MTNPKLLNNIVCFEATQDWVNDWIFNSFCICILDFNSPMIQILLFYSSMQNIPNNFSFVKHMCYWWLPVLLHALSMDSPKKSESLSGPDASPASSESRTPSPSKHRVPPSLADTQSVSSSSSELSGKSSALWPSVSEGRSPSLNSVRRSLSNSLEAIPAFLQPWRAHKTHDPTTTLRSIPEYNNMHSNHDITYGRSFKIL